MSFEGMGAVLDTEAESCGFRVWAPNASDVHVTGRFCEWREAEHPLAREGGGYWATTTRGVGAGEPYRFVIQNGSQHWRVDAYARDVAQDGDGHLNGVVLDRRATWSAFSTPRFDDLILYQLHVGSLAGHGDGIDVKSYGAAGWTATCEDIVCKLDYIRSMGFNALALLPLGEHPRSPEQAHMGYAPTSWFAPESDYGTPASVRRLVDEAHRRGLAVIFDVVYNHASIDENLYWDYDGPTGDGGIYFEGGGDSTFGRIPAHWKREVRSFFLAPHDHHWNIVRYFLGSHDQIRDRRSGAEADHRYPVQKLGGREDWTARAQCRMGWCLNVAAPGIPMLFMGCEGHLPGYWWPSLDDNPDHRDHRMDWSKVGDPIGAPMQRLVADANHLRMSHPALRSHTLEMTHVDRGNNVFAFRRWSNDGDVVLTVVNFSEREWHDVGYRLSTGVGGAWREIMNSQAPVYGGYADSGNGPDARSAEGDGQVPIRLPKWSVLCFRKLD